MVVIGTTCGRVGVEGGARGTSTTKADNGTR